MKLKREIIIKFKLSEDNAENFLATENLLKDFLDLWKSDSGIISMLDEIEKNNSFYEVHFNIYYSPILETPRGIIITGEGNSRF